MQKNTVSTTNRRRDSKMIELYTNNTKIVLFGFFVQRLVEPVVFADLVVLVETLVVSSRWQYSSLSCRNSSINALFWFSSPVTRSSKHLMYSFFLRRHSRAASLKYRELLDSLKIEQKSKLTDSFVNAFHVFVLYPRLHRVVLLDFVHDEDDLKTEDWMNSKMLMGMVNRYSTTTVIYNSNWDHLIELKMKHLRIHCSIWSTDRTLEDKQYLPERK